MLVSSLPPTLGALLIGGLFASMLGGMVNLQTMLYYRSYKRDPKPLKMLIFSVWLLDNLHTGFIWGGLWFDVIQNYGDETVDAIPWCFALTLLITALVTSLVQCFFAHRIFLLSRKNWFMTAPILALTFLRLAAACVSTSEMLRYPSFAEFRVHAQWIVTLGLSVSSGVDILTTAFLVYLFQTNRTGTGHLNHILDKLILYGVEAGSLTCLGAIASMLFWVITPRTLIFLGIHVVIGKLYANSLLATLNTRKSIRHGGNCCSCEQGAPVVYLERPGRVAGQFRPDPSIKIPGMVNDLQINVETYTNVQYDGKSTTSIPSLK